MSHKLRNLGLISIGMIAGVAISLNISAIGRDEAKTAGGLPIEELRSFADVFNAVKQGYVEPIDDKKLITYAISGMLSNLDPHSTYLDADAFKDLQVSTQGEFGGLGIEVGMEDGVVKVISPIEDTPAYKAGIKAGDYIIKLDDTAVRGMSLNDAVKRMRGKPKTNIHLTVVRKGETKPLEFDVMRDKIKVQSVKSKLMEPGYGYVRITQFQEETTAELTKALEKLTKDNKENLKGLVLDLRNDPGGLLNSAVGVSAAFLPPKALVVSTDGRTDDSKRKFLAVPEDYQRGRGEDALHGLPSNSRELPLIVLVNGGSASASEIVAGALQDHKRAVVAGTQTFGKGSVQSVLPLSANTAIKLTTARYFTPSGRSIQAKGITPDVNIEESANGTPRNRFKEADLDHHLDNADAVKEAEKPKTGKADKTDKSRSKGGADSEEELMKPLEFASKDDYQLTQAMNLLKAWQIMKRN